MVLHNLSTTLRNALADAVDAEINTGAGTATIRLVNNAAPATVLAELEFANPAFGDAVAGVITANAITSETSAPNSGTTDKFIISNRNNTEVLRGDVATAASDLILNTTTITAGDAVSISSATLTMPASG